jgi:hypothetical protein
VEVAAWFRHNGGHVRLWLWLITLAVPLFAIFASMVRGRLAPMFRDLFFFGVIAFVAETAVQGWILAGLSWHADELQPATARTLLDISSFWGPVLTGTTVVTLIPIAVLGVRGGESIPRWLGILAGVVIIEQLVETVTIFGQGVSSLPEGP